VQDLHATLSLGSVVKDRYIVEDLLGKGGFGAVYQVRDQRVRGNLFALKEVIDPNTEERERFAFECEVLTRLDHPALPRVYRVFEDNKNIRVYMLMDYVAGPNLEMLRQQQSEKRFSLPQALHIMKPIMDAVSYLHAQQPPIIHRDIKPANIIVPHGDDGSVLVDFGIAKEYEQDSTTTAVRRCSPGYGAPEQYARGTNLRTDIYGLAATLYAILTGVVPTDALYRLTQMGSRSTDPLEPVQQLAPNVPAHVAEAIHRALAINSNERFATVEEFQQALNVQPIAEPRVTIVPVATAKQVEDMPTKVFPPTKNIAPYATIDRSPEVNRARRRRRILPIFFALLALLALVGITFGTGLLKGQHFGQATNGTATTQLKPTLTPTTKPTATPTTKPTATPTTIPPTATTAPTSPPTTAPPVYPVLGKTYNGQIVNTLVTPNVTAPIVLSNIAQNNANISGYLDIQSTALQGSGNFTGTVSANKTIQFVVASFAGHDPLAFTGTIQSNGSISNGIYCGINANGSCDDAQGHGTWSTNAPSANNTPRTTGYFVLTTLDSNKEP
jgi:serine/threonine protein kinase